MLLHDIDYWGNRSFLTWTFVRPNFTFPYHYHPEIEIICVRSGHCSLVVNDQPTILRPGSIAIIGSNVPHFYHNEPEDSKGPHWASHIMMLFRPDVFGAAFFAAPEMEVARTVIGKIGAGGALIKGTANRRITRIMTGLNHRADIPNLVALLNVLQILHEGSSRDLEIFSTVKSIPEMHRQDVTRLLDTFKLIREEFARRITLKEVSKAARMAPASFSRFFRAKTGRTFIQYLVETRINEACKRLIATEDAITEICYDCGFGNLSNFNRQFRLHNGVTPSEFRDRWRQKIAVQSRTKSKRKTK